MPGRHRTRFWGIAGVLGLAVVAASWYAATVGRGRARRRPPAPNFDAATPLPVLAEAMRQGDARALAALFTRVTTKAGEMPEAIPAAEAPAWVDALGAMRTGFLKFGAYGRGSALVAGTKVLNRFAASPAPAIWIRALPPLHDLYTAGMSDPDLNVRVTALVQVGQLWHWGPGCTPMPVEEEALADWKYGLHGPVVRRLSDREPKARMAAIACLGLVPIDDLAAPAVAYLDDPSGEVRQQVLASFASRRDLLGEDAILKHLDDTQPGVPQAAEAALRHRGLTEEQISLGRMLYHPKAELRASVIPLIRDRTDIDPTVWLLQLSRDRDETVRAAAVEALAGRLSPEVRSRLAEMARTDQSPAVRQAAGRIVPADLGSIGGAAPPARPGGRLEGDRHPPADAPRHDGPEPEGQLSRAGRGLARCADGRCRVADGGRPGSLRSGIRHPSICHRGSPVAAELAGAVHVGGQVPRAAQEQQEPEHQDRDHREHAGGQVALADRRRAEGGQEPARAAVCATSGRPKTSEMTPIRIGELMSPNRWIRKIPSANPAARWVGGTTFAVTVLHGPSTDAISTIAPKSSPSDVTRSGSRIARPPSGIAASTARLAISR